MNSSDSSADRAAEPISSAGPRPKRWYEGIYARATTALLLMLGVAAAFNVFMTINIWVTVAAGVEQRMNWNLAEEIAARLQPELAQGASEEWIRERLVDFQHLHPAIGFYILNDTGRIIHHTKDIQRLRLRQIPLNTLIQATGPLTPEIPIRALDPTYANSTVFSVSRTTCEGEPCFVYLTLTGGLFQMLQETQGGYAVMRYVVLLVSMGLLLLILMGVALFFILSGGFRDMLRVVRRVGQGDYSERIAIRGNDEIAEISRAINSMADAVEESIEKLAATDKQRRELIASISHDLRSPLTVMEGFLETILARGEQLTPEERKAHLERIYRNVLQQKQLTTDLFELSKLEARERTANLEAFSVLELVYDTAQKFELQAKERQMEIVVGTTRDPGPVLADISMIDRVLSNLISNAIRYCPEGSLIQLQVRDRGEQVEVEVRDNGEGIAQEDLKHIFDSFYRVAKDRNRVSGGSGLGLAIVKKMLESHGSDILAESTLGEGTSFRFWLQKVSAQNRAPAASRDAASQQKTAGPDPSTVTSA